MLTKQKAIKYLTIALLSGVGLSAPFVIHHVQINAMAQAKVHTTLTKGETVIYNNKDIKSGKHYIPEGIRVNYEFKPEGIQIWATGKNPKGFLKKDKDHEFMATYASLPELGISPSEAQRDKYEMQQKRVNKKMKKSGVNNKKPKKIPGTKPNQSNNRSKDKEPSNNNNNDDNNNGSDNNSSNAPDNDSNDSNNGGSDNGKKNNQPSNKDNSGHNKNSGQNNQNNNEGDDSSNQGSSPSSSANSSKDKGNNENRAALNAQKRKYENQINQMKKQFGDKLKHQKEEDALKNKEQQLDNTKKALSHANSRTNSPDSEQKGNDGQNSKGSANAPQKDQAKAEGQVLPRTSETSKIVNSLIAMIVAGSAYLINKGFKKEN